MKFPVVWLYREGLNAQACRIIRVLGESMEPTLPDGCSILVNHEGRERRHGKVFVIRRGDELIVKRTLHDNDAGWLLVSDNPDKRAWPATAVAGARNAARRGSAVGLVQPTVADAADAPAPRRSATCAHTRETAAASSKQ